MLLGDDLLFLHVPRSAGTYIANRIEGLGVAEQVYHEGKRPHVPARELPQEWTAERRVVASVRNPWDWYVSWIHYFLRQDGQAVGWLADRLGGSEWPGFRVALKMCLTPTGDLSRECRTYSTHGPRPALQEQADLDCGLYSWMMQETLGVSLGSLGGYMVDEFIDASAPIDHALTRLLGKHVLPGEPVNQGGFGEAHTPHGPPAAYYDSEMTQWVAQADRYIVSRFGYVAPGTHAMRGVI